VSQNLDASLERTLEYIHNAGPRAVIETKRLIEFVSQNADKIDECGEELGRRIAKARASEEGRAGLDAFFTRSPPPWRENGTA